MRASTVTSSAVVGSSSTTQLGIADERGRDQHALLHAAGELMGISRDQAVRDPVTDLCERRDGRSRAASPEKAAMVDERFGHLESDGQARVQRGERILEHNADVAAA